MSGSSPDPEGLSVEVDAGVATLWLDRPAKRNAVTYPMWLAIAARCDDLATDPAVRMLVVRGRGDHFCAGADIAGFGAVDPLTYREANEAADEALASFPKPTVAVVSGSCIGGGTELALACDLRLADTTARFGITPARLGIVYPAAATRRAVQTIGPSATKHLLYSAEIVDASHALRVGLVDELLAPDDLAGRVEHLTDLLAHRRSLLTQMAAKDIVRAALEGPVGADVVDRWDREAASAPDAAEGVAAFLEQRDPAFEWSGPIDPSSRNI